MTVLSWCAWVFGRFRSSSSFTSKIVGMPKARVAILRTSPETVIHDYHRLLNLANYQDVIAKDTDTALKVNISWHFFFPGSSTTPWQLDGVRSEEHTSELQSQSNLVCRLLLEKKK